MRLNRKRPNIRIKKTDRGGTEVFGYGDKEFVKDLAREYGILNAKISVGKGSTTEDVIDFFFGECSLHKSTLVFEQG
jgi:Predicted GTPase